MTIGNILEMLIFITKSLFVQLELAQMQFVILQ